MRKNITTDNYHFFLTDEFSQWYPSKFKNDIGIEFCCCEQWMMYSKAELFGDNEIMKKILETNNPDEMKKLGRQIKNFDQAVWDAKALTIVFLGNIMKFSQNPDLWEILDKTENRELVEAAHYDKIWGIGLRAEDAILLDVSQWLGENKLGMAIMETRAVLRSHPELIVLTKSNEEKKFSFYDSLGQKIIRLNNTELAQSLNCSVDNLEFTLNNLEEDIKLPYAPFVQDTMDAKREDLLNSLKSFNNIYKKKLNR